MTKWCKLLLLLLLILQLQTNTCNASEISSGISVGIDSEPVPEADPHWNDILFITPKEMQQTILLTIQGRPAEISADDLNNIAESFRAAYNIQQHYACADRESNNNDYSVIELNSVEIIDDGVIQSFGSYPRNIDASIKFTFLVTLKMACTMCLTADKVNIFDESSRGSQINDYEVPFPNHVILTPCVPTQQNVMQEFVMELDRNDITSVQDVYSIDPIPLGRGDCEHGDDDDLAPPNFDFVSVMTLAFVGDEEVSNLSDQLGQLEQTIVETLNELNVLNANTCDSHSRIVTDATIEIVQNKDDILQGDGNDGEHNDDIQQGDGNNDGEQHQRRKLYPYLDGLFFSLSKAKILGKCNGCPSNCPMLMNDVEESNVYCGDPGGRHPSSDDYCYCVNDRLDAGLPAIEEFISALEKQIQILRSETNFTLIESLVYVVEDEPTESCCGWPIDGNVPVDVNGIDFRAAVSSYIDSGISNYGYPINCWDVSGVTDTSSAFQNQANFNEHLNCWDTSSITTMDRMFLSSRDFNQDISTWDTSKVSNLSGMFYLALAFNQDISNWDTSNAIDMNYMFSHASSFNQDISNWDTSNVVTMREMFLGAKRFQQDLCPWRLSANNLDFTAGGVQNIFLDTHCLNMTDPLPNVGPWCLHC